MASAPPSPGIWAGNRPVIIYRPRYEPYRRYPKDIDSMALYVHYLYLPGKAGQQQYPPKMTPHLRKRLGCCKFFTVINEANRTFF